jgi:DNA end-binding protein Ku
MANGMRATWSGTISFAMMAIPVKLYKAASSQDFSFNQLHKEDGKPVNYVKVCKQHDEPVELAASDIQRAYQVSKGNYVPITDEDLESLPLPSKKTLALETFVPTAEVDPIYFENAYYVEPEAAGAKPYSLLVNALRNQGVVAIAKIAVRQRESLAVLRAVGNVLVMHTMFYGTEVRDFEVNAVVTTDAEQRMADMLVSALTQAFDSTQYSDAYHTAVTEMIAAKLDGNVPAPTATPAAPAVTDLMAALQASLAAVQATKPAPAAEPAPAKEPEFAF